MAAANGFITVSPDTRYGDVEGNYPNTYVFAAKFTAPGSGSLNVSEIGLYCYAAAGAAQHLAIFTDDAVNGCPDTIVADSDTGAFASSQAMAKLSFVYSTLPVIIGGGIYWLAFIGNFNNAYPSRFASGGTAVYVTGRTYPTWPTAAQWETHTDQTVNLSLYAVYAAAGGGLLIPAVMYYYNQLRAT